MATVELYTTPICPFCQATKRLLDSKGVSYSDVDVICNMGVFLYLDLRTDCQCYSYLYRLMQKTIK